MARKGTRNSALSTKRSKIKAYSLTALSKTVKKQDGLESPEFAKAIDYIAAYQWNEADGQLDAQKVSEYTKNIQKYLGVKQTGIIDYKLVKLMEHTPRCGLPDYAVSDGPMASKWGLNELTYFIETYVSGLSKTDQDQIIANAFGSWGAVANLKFTRVNTSGKANFVISTGRGRGQGFDGPGNTLAWAYLPSGNNFRGQLLSRFDLDETWINDRSKRGILMENVACHEFGHLLGLDHSRVSSALMAPYYNPNIPKPVDNDDVRRIVALYGRPATPAPPPPAPPSTPTTPKDKYTVTIQVSSLDDIKINDKPATDFRLIS